MSVSMELGLWWPQGPWGRRNTAQDLPDCSEAQTPARASGPILLVDERADGALLSLAPGSLIPILPTSSLLENRLVLRLAALGPS